jgi:hypothetical protein
MSLVTLIIVLIVIGIALAFIPMDARVKQIVIAVVAVVALVAVLRALGLV